jgi:LemA protein
VSPLGAAALFAVLLLLVVGGFLLVVTYNAVVALRNRIDKAWGNVEVALRQRHDQLPALVDAVRDVMAFEQEVLEEVTRQRARFVPDAPVPEQGAVSAATTAAVHSLIAVVEQYPQVRSQENVLRLQGEIERLEGLIADRRELYNDQVFRYNTTIAQVPAVALAALLGWGPRPFFDAGDEAEARPVVSLGAGPRTADPAPAAAGPGAGDPGAGGPGAGDPGAGEPGAGDGTRDRGDG